MGWQFLLGKHILYQLQQENRKTQTLLLQPPSKFPYIFCHLPDLRPSHVQHLSTGKHNQYLVHEQLRNETGIRITKNCHKIPDRKNQPENRRRVETKPPLWLHKKRSYQPLPPSKKRCTKNRRRPLYRSRGHNSQKHLDKVILKSMTLWDIPRPLPLDDSLWQYSSSDTQRYTPRYEIPLAQPLLNHLCSSKMTNLQPPPT